jgi:hypothetical protein
MTEKASSSTGGSGNTVGSAQEAGRPMNRAFLIHDHSRFLPPRRDCQSHPTDGIIYIDLDPLSPDDEVVRRTFAELFAPHPKPISAQDITPTSGRGVTRFKKREVARIVEAVKMTGALGTFEFRLDNGVVSFCMTGESDARPPAKIDDSPNPWDKVLKNGKAKPALTLCKKVP